MGGGLHLHRPGHRAVGPVPRLQGGPVPLQIGPFADGDGQRLGVHVEHVAGRPVAGGAQAPALADGHQLHRVHPAPPAPGGVHHPARPQRYPVPQEGPAPGSGGDEAHVLAVGLGRGHQPPGPGLGSDLVLGGLPHRQQQAGQHRRAEHVQHVGLVLGPVGPPGQPRPLEGGHHPGVVAGGDLIEAQGVGPAQEPVELHVPVALDAGVGGPARGVVGHVRVHHVALEVVAEVEHMVLDAEPVGHPPGVVHVGHRAAAGVAGAAPQLHGHPHHLAAGVEEAGHSHRRVDPAGHGHQNPAPATSAPRVPGAGLRPPASRGRSPAAPAPRVPGPGPQPLTSRGRPKIGSHRWPLRPRRSGRGARQRRCHPPHNWPLSLRRSGRGARRRQRWPPPPGRCRSRRWCGPATGAATRGPAPGGRPWPPAHGTGPGPR